MARSDGFELWHGEELQVGADVAGPPTLGTRGVAQRVLVTPALGDRMLEYGVDERQHVAHGLRGKSGGEHLAGQRLDSRSRDLLERERADARLQMDSPS